MTRTAAKSSATSESESSPEKQPIPTSIHEKRKSLRSHDKLYPNLNLNEINHSPVTVTTPKTTNANLTYSDDEEIDGEIRRSPRFSPFAETTRFFYEEGELRRRASPAPDKNSKRNQTPVPPPKETPTKTSNFKLLKFFGILVFIVALIFVLLSKTPPTAPSTTTNCSHFMDLNKKFPDQDKKLFKALKSGAESFIHDGETSVFSLFSTDEKFMGDVMENVIQATKECIHQTKDPLNLSKDNLSESLVTNYKEELKSRSIMIVNNVDKASPLVVGHLHSFCDTYNPLVKPSIIFLTILVPTSPEGKPVDFITEHLERRWKSLESNIRNPLITRMLDQTFFLKPF